MAPPTERERPPPNTFVEAFEAARTGLITPAAYLQRAVDPNGETGNVGRLATALKEEAETDLVGVLAHGVFEHARGLMNRQEPEAALALFEAAQPALDRVGPAVLATRCRSGRGSCLNHLERPRDGAVLLAQAVREFVQFESPEHDEYRVFAALNLAISYERLDRPGDVVEVLGAAFPVWWRLIERQNEPRLTKGVAGHLWGWATAQSQLGKLERAVEPYEPGLRLLRALKADRQLARGLADLGGLLLRLGRPADALVAYEEAIPLLQTDPGSAAEAEFDRARCLADLGRQCDAVRGFAAALGLLRFSAGEPDRALEMRCLLALGREHSRAGRPDLARAAYEQALPILRQLGWVEEEIAAWDAHADVLIDLRRYQEAVTACESGLALAKPAGALRSAARFECLKAGALMPLERREEAARSYDAAASAFRGLGDLVSFAAALEGRGYALAALDRDEEALAALHAAFEVYLRYGSLHDRARCLVTRSGVLARGGRFAAAAAGFTVARGWYDELGDGDRRLECSEHVVRAVRDLGDAIHRARGVPAADAMDEAQQETARNLAILQNCVSPPTWHSPDRPYLDCIGLVFELSGRTRDALAHAESAYQELPADAAPDVRGRMEGFRGRLLAALGEFDEAETAFDAAAAYFDIAGIDSGVLHYRQERAEALGQAGRFEEAHAECTGLLASLASGKRQGSRFGALFRRGCLHARQEQWAAALGDFDEALAGADDARPGLEAGSEIYFRRALCLAGLRRWGEAAAELARAPEDGLPEQHRLARRFLAGRVGVALGAPEGVTEVAAARSELRAVRRRAGVDETTLGWSRERRREINWAVEACLDAGRVEEAYEAARDGKAGLLGDLSSRGAGPRPWDYPEVWVRRRELVDALRAGSECGGRLRTYLRAWQLARSSPLATWLPSERSAPPTPAPLPSILAALPARHAILDFWVLGSDRVAVFVLTRAGLSHATLSFPFPKLAARVRGLLDTLYRRHTPPRDELLDDLNGYLFAPLKARLRAQQVEALYLVPHGLLQLLPLHASRGRGGYLCDEFAVSYLPSAALLPQLPAPGAAGEALSLANPGRGTPATLPFAEWEARKLGSLWPGRYVSGPAATVSQVADWGDSALVHFGCHGYSELLYAPLSRLDLADDSLLAHDVMNQLPALRAGAIVALNGCRTSMRDLRDVDECMGLMSGFLLRGASSVLATLWNVHDACAATFAVEFLGRIRLGVPPARAFGSAHRRVRSMTHTDLLDQGEELLHLFPADEHPEETVALCAALAETAYLAGLTAYGGRYAELGRATSLRLGRPAAGDRFARLIADPPAAVSSGEHPFQHPVFWSAFQLVGRTQ